VGLIKFVSFDMEGTLIETSFSNLIWETDIPRLYADRHSLCFEEAKRKVLEEYDHVGEHQPEWYDVEFWFRRFNLIGDWRKLLESRKGDCKPYTEVHGVLRRLSLRHPVLVCSNTIREFLDVQLTVLPKVFTRVFSAPSDFGTVKKSSEFYGRICRILGVKPRTVVHVGDSKKFDYEEARNQGVQAFFLDRTREETGEHVVHDLQEFEAILSEKEGKC
jgi:HAD superfamily hydrolase (TIGR01549 family)